jgi:hypothetical protein
MRIIKASIDIIREWRVNSSHLVADDGTISSVLDPALEPSLAAVIRTAKQKLKSQEQTVKVGRLTATIKVEITRTGRSNDEFTIETTVDGLRVVSGREIIAARLLDEVGECQLRHPNGVILKVIRDPGVHRPTFKESLQTAPKPANCSCASWGKAHPGVHYATCPWNRLAPPDEQAPEAPTEEELKHLPRHAFASLSRSPGAPTIVSRPDPKEVVKEAVVLDPPETCRHACLNDPTPKGVPIPAGQHHPMCTFARAWAQKTSKEIPRWLVDLNTGERVREATDLEIGQADVAARRMGTPIIHVENTPYAVLTESDLGTGASPSP